MSNAPAPWPSLFGVLASPRAYGVLAYLLLSIILGTFAFTWVTTGLALSLGLLVLVIGVPVLLLVLASIRALGLAHGRLLAALTGIPAPQWPPLLPEGLGWADRLKALLLDGHAWRCALFLLLQLPLGLLNLVVVLLPLLACLALAAAPLAPLWPGTSGVQVFGETLAFPAWTLPVLALAGVMGLVGLLHAALALGRLQGLLASALLGGRRS